MVCRDASSAGRDRSRRNTCHNAPDCEPDLRSTEPMKVSIRTFDLTRADQLRERLDRAAQLRCQEHDQTVVAVTIFGRENGWFDSQWITCCESLEEQAVSIVRKRC